MFDANFFRMVLPESVRQACQGQPEHVPVVELHLPDSLTLDVCHIETLASTWLAVAYYRNPNENSDVETAFLPYPLVQWVTISVHPPHARHIGFDIARSVAASVVVPAFATPIIPPQAAESAPSAPPGA